MSARDRNADRAKVRADLMKMRLVLMSGRREDFIDPEFYRTPREIAGARARILELQEAWDRAYATLSRWERFKYRWLGAEGIGLPVRDL